VKAIGHETDFDRPSVEMILVGLTDSERLPGTSEKGRLLAAAFQPISLPRPAASSASSAIVAPLVMAVRGSEPLARRTAAFERHGAWPGGRRRGRDRLLCAQLLMLSLMRNTKG